MDCTSCIFSMNSLSHMMNSLKALLQYEEKIKSLVGELAELKGIVGEVSKKLDAAERLGFKAPRQVLEWLDSAEKFEAEVTSISAGLNTGITCLGNLPLNVCSSYQLMKRTQKTLALAGELKSSKEALTKLIGDLIPHSFMEVTNPAISLGVESVLEGLQQHARDDNIFGIFGKS